MVDLKLINKNLSDFKKQFEIFAHKVSAIHNQLHQQNLQSNDFKGWLDWPIVCSKNEMERIKWAASKIKKQSDVLVVIGIGGSYLGAKAALEFFYSENYNLINKSGLQIFFVGNSLASRELLEILEICKDKEVSVNVVSKSGTTTEPAVAFRIFKKFMENKYGKENAKERIYCTTDAVDGALRKMAQDEGYECFEIPKNIGGRFSVLTAVGLLPMAAAGINIEDVINGAKCAYERFLNVDVYTNECYQYAIMRNVFYSSNKQIEMFVGYEPRLKMLFEWCKQLFAESEGKDGKGLFPVSSIFTTDLHSLGQFIQQGNKILFETVLVVKNEHQKLTIESDKKNLDGLNYLVGKTLDCINKTAFEATLKAHTDGGVPNIILEIDSFNEHSFGYLIYFFEKACAMSGYLLGVNPFDQPGVEGYKNNMFKMLGKPSY